MTAGIAFAAVLASASASGQDKAAHDRRSAERHVELFRWLDRDNDGAVTRLEALGDVNFTPVFVDIDINRDDIVTMAELERYLELRYGIARR